MFHGPMILEYYNHNEINSNSRKLDNSELDQFFNFKNRR